MDFKQFVSQNKIRIENTYTDSNPHMTDSNNMDNWKSTLKMGSKQVTLYFSKGYGHNGAEPSADEILECVQMDNSLIQYGYEEFLSELGYEDTCENRKSFKVMQAQERKFKKFLGDKYERFMNLSD